MVVWTEPNDQAHERTSNTKATGSTAELEDKANVMISEEHEDVAVNEVIADYEPKE